MRSQLEIATKSATKRAPGRPRDAGLAHRRQEQILAAAAGVFAQHGYQVADLNDVAEVCGIAKGTIYLYFPSKEKLFLAAADRAMRAMCESVRESYESVKDPIDRLEVAIRAYLGYFRDHPSHAELIIIERAEFRERKTPTYLEHRKANSGEWERLYADLIREGRFRKIPVRRIVGVICDLLYGTMFTNHFSGQHRSVESQARDVIDIFFNGILTPAERRRRVK